MQKIRADIKSTKDYITKLENELETRKKKLEKMKIAPVAAETKLPQLNEEREMLEKEVAELQPLV